MSKLRMAHANRLGQYFIEEAEDASNASKNIEGIFTHGRFPEVGQKQKTERKKEEEKNKLVITMAIGQVMHGARKPPKIISKKREREKKRLNDGNNNGQATHGARKPPGPKDRTIVITMAKLCMAHASRLGQLM